MKKLLVLSLIAAAVAAQASIVYDNTGASVFTTGSGPRAHLLDDVNLGGTDRDITGYEFAFVVQGANNGFDVLVTFWDTLNTSDATMVASNAIITYRVSVGALANGAYTTGMMNLGAGFNWADGAGAVSHAYVATGTTTFLSTTAGATSAFYGLGVTVGSSQDAYWRDTNNDGNFGSGEARFFGGGTALANFYQKIEAVPEPASLAVLGLGALVLIRRRK